MHHSSGAPKAPVSISAGALSREFEKADSDLLSDARGKSRKFWS